MNPGMWTLPNALTGLRLLAVPFLAVVLVVDGDSSAGRLTALALFVAASLTDLVDGWLARRLDQCTEWGALADPIADKALVGTSLVCLSGHDLVPWWATAVVLAREVAVTGLRLTVLRHGVIPASRGGKVKTVSQTALIMIALATPAWTEALMVTVVGTVAWTVITGLDYAAKAAALSRAAASPDRSGGSWALVSPLEDAAPASAGSRQGGGGSTSR